MTVSQHMISVAYEAREKISNAVQRPRTFLFEFILFCTCLTGVCELFSVIGVAFVTSHHKVRTIK